MLFAEKFQGRNKKQMRAEAAACNIPLTSPDRQQRNIIPMSLYSYGSYEESYDSMITCSLHKVKGNIHVLLALAHTCYYIHITSY